MEETFGDVMTKAAENKRKIQQMKSTTIGCVNFLKNLQ